MNWIDFIIPTQFGLLTNLETLDLSVNEFMQTIPQELSQLTKLKELFLNENKLKGGSDGDVFESMKSLEVLDLSWNEKLKFPDTFLYPMSLKELYLRGISDTSRISTHIGRLSNLEVLDISENGLIGTVPTEIGHMTSLLELYLEDNSFSGTFPSSIDQSQLNRLGLDDNFLDPDK